MRRSGPTVLLALAATVWLGACGTDQPGTTAGQDPQGQAADRPDDRTISTRVQARFYESDTVRTTDIDVMTSDGVVTLDGTVPSDEVKQEAVEQARGVDGVVRVEDRLAVPGSGAAATGGEQPGQAARPGAKGPGTGALTSNQPGQGGQLSAGWVTAKIQGQYFADQDVKGRRIDVDTTNGVVTLNGEVDSEQARKRAVEIAQQTEGVIRVDDQLRVVPAGASPAEGGESSGTTGERPQVEDEEITSRIQAKYFTNEEVRDSDIDVSSSDGVVTLKGTVTSEAQRDEAVSIARNTNGVSRVNDELTVEAAAAGTAGSVRPVPGAQGERGQGGQSRSVGEKIDDGWITTKIQSKFFLDDHIRGTDVNVTTRNGAVTLEGVVESADAKRQAVQMAENTDGVTRVVDRLKVQPQGGQPKQPQEK